MTRNAPPSAGPSGRPSVLHNAVRQWRTEAGRTQAELAAAVGVTRQTIISIERGGYEPSVALALALAQELGGPIDGIFWLAPAAGARS